MPGTNRKNPLDFPVHAVTSTELVCSPGFTGLAEAVAATGRCALHLRAHGLGGREICEIACKLRRLTAGAGAALVVNDRLDAALAVGADAIHLGRRSLPLGEAAGLARDAGMRVGYSCHGLDEALWAARAGADYIYLGTVFASRSKPGVEPAGTELLERVCRESPVPVYAIGGLDPGNAGRAARAGASGAALITAIWQADDIAKAAASLAGAFGK